MSKTVKISEKLHSELKEYCINNNLKLNGWIENELSKIISKIKTISELL